MEVKAFAGMSPVFCISFAFVTVSFTVFWSAPKNLGLDDIDKELLV
jgi:hypothetical protein